jgi:putative peptidoglycan lipid II flippase
MEDSRKSIIHSGTRFFSGTMLSRITGLMRDVTTAAAFGSHPSVAALMVAYRFSHLLRRLFGEGALHSAFIPQFEELRQNDPQRAARFYRDLSLSLIFFLFLITLAAEALIFTMFSFGGFSEENREILYLTSLMFPSILFICLFGLNSSLLHCEKKFFIAGMAPVAFNLTWILCLYFLVDDNLEKSVVSLAVGIVGACALQCFVTIPSSRKFLKSLLNGSVWKGAGIFSSDVKRLGKPLALGIMGVSASQINSALDAVFSRFADLEGPAFLWYAMRLQQAPLALFGLALSGALLPPLARAIKNGDNERFMGFLDFAFRNCVGLMLPATFGAFVLGASLVNIVYVRENFTDGTAYETLLCLWAYLPGLLPAALVVLLASASYAKGDYRNPTLASFLSVLVNLILNSIMVFYLGMGAVSVALATSASAWVNFFVLSKTLLKGDLSFSQSQKKTSLGNHFIRVGACTVCASLFTGLFSFYYWNDHSLGMLLQNIPYSFPREFIPQLMHFSSQSLCFLAVLWLSSRFLKVDVLKLH